MKRIFALSVLVTLLAMAFPAMAQDSLNVSRISQQYVTQEFEDIAAQGIYTYAASRMGGLRIFDVSHLATPREVGHCDAPRCALSVAVQGSYAYVGDSSFTFHVINISNPYAPIAVGSCTIPATGNIIRVKVSGNYAYLVQANGVLRIVNICNPTDPIEMGSYPTGSTGRNVAVHGNNAYFLTASMLYSLNVSDPTLPLRLAQCAISGVLLDVAINESGTNVFVANGQTGMKTFNVTNPAAPFQVSLIALYGNAASVLVAGNLAYVGISSSIAGLKIVDVSSPAVPSLVGSCDVSTSSAIRLALINPIACQCLSANAIKVINVATPSAPQVTGIAYPSGNSRAAVARDNFVYLATAQRGLTVFDVSDRAHPVDVGVSPTAGTDGYGLALGTDYLYLASTQGLRIINIVNPYSPYETGALPTAVNAHGVAVQGDYAYVAQYLISQGYCALLVVNISNPAAPQLYGLCSMTGHAVGVAVQGNYAYVVTSEGSLRIVNISIPTAPQIVGTIGSGCGYTAVAVRDQYAYVTDTWGRLNIVDVSNSAAPRLATVTEWSHTGAVLYGISLIDNLAYVSKGNDGIVIYDVGAPTSPNVIGSYNTPGRALSAAASGAFAFVADNQYLGVYDCSLLNPCHEEPRARVELLRAGPPAWGYRLIWESGCMGHLTFTGFGDCATGSVSGAAATAHWVVSTYSSPYIPSVVFSTANFLTQGSIDTFWLNAADCDNLTIRWCAGDTCSFIDGPLPVELLSFEAAPGDAQITLNWRTASEQNNDHFEIERDGAVVARVTGQGNSSTETGYHWTDTGLSNSQRYRYTLYSVTISGERQSLQTVESAPQPGTALITEYALHDAYPNPFNPTTTLTFDLPEGGLTRIEIFNLNGQRVATLVNSPQTAGRHTVQFDATNLPSGMYLARFSAGSYQASRKLLLLK